MNKEAKSRYVCTGFRFIHDNEKFAKCTFHRLKLFRKGKSYGKNDNDLSVCNESARTCGYGSGQEPGEAPCVADTGEVTFSGEPAWRKCRDVGWDVPVPA